MTEDDVRRIAGEAVGALRAELTVMPRFCYHQPLDYNLTTLPPAFEPPVHVQGVSLPLPSVPDRMGYSADNAEYLNWGKFDHDLIVQRIEAHGGKFGPNTAVMDFGCSSGRVLRHFDLERAASGTELIGVDVQARPIEWMRQHFPPHFKVFHGQHPSLSAA